MYPTQLKALVEDMYPTQLKALDEEMYPIQLKALVEEMYPTQLKALVEEMYPTQLKALVEDLPGEGEGGLPAARSVVLLGEVVVTGSQHPVLEEKDPQNVIER